jgi:hypothetical protein
MTLLTSTENLSLGSGGDKSVRRNRLQIPPNGKPISISPYEPHDSCLNVCRCWFIGFGGSPLEGHSPYDLNGGLCRILGVIEGQAERISLP